jgi:hypothetical protein
MMAVSMKLIQPADVLVLVMYACAANMNGELSFTTCLFLIKNKNMIIFHFYNYRRPWYLVESDN